MATINQTTENTTITYALLVVFTVDRTTDEHLQDTQMIRDIFPVGTPKQVAACREYVRGILSHFERDVERHGFEVAVASSGTAEAVVQVAHALSGAEPLRTYNCYEVATDDVQRVVSALTRHRTAAAHQPPPPRNRGFRISGRFARRFLRF